MKTSRRDDAASRSAAPESRRGSRPTPGRGLVRCLWALLLALLPAAAVAAQGWPILQHEIEASIDPPRNHLAVTDRIDLGAPPAPQQPLSLLLHRDLQIQAIDMQGEPLEFERAQGFQPRHFWDRPDYERMDDYAMAGEIIVRPPDGGWPASPRLTLRYAGSVYDSLRPPKVAYSRGFDTTTGLVEERGTYLAASTFWIPWSSEEPFRFRLRATVPAGWESVSQGTWAGRRLTDDGRVESLWVCDTPMVEAYLIAGPYVVREAAHEEVKVYTFTYENTPDDLCQTYLDATGDYLRMYNDMIGPYPFDKFALVENWWQSGYGMPSFTLLGDRVIRLPFIVHTSYGHEILHNWWGNGVFIDESQGNWCEGLTTYLADYTYKERDSQAAARDYRLGQLQSYLDYASAGGRDFALRRFGERQSPSTQAVGYGKTMMIFHMLRDEIGPEAFRDGLRHFYAEHRFRKASWDDLVRSFEAASKRPLAAWFEQWIGRPGAPSLSVRQGQDAGGRWIDIVQEGDVYELRVTLAVATHDEVQRRQVAVHGAAVRMKLEAGTRWVAVDPDFEIFRKLHRGEIPPALSQVLGADSTRVVIGSRCTPEMAAALRQLADTWSRNHDQVVQDEADFSAAGGRSVWLFGDGERVRALFRNSRAFGAAPGELLEAARTRGHSLVACFRDPERPEIAWTAVLPDDPGVVPALGRKLPHYGRYSYLVFEGENNVDKGNWIVETSPMRVEFLEE